MLNKKNSSSNIKSALFAGALAASTAAYADQVNGALNTVSDTEILSVIQDLEGKEWGARKLGNGTQIIKEADTIKIVYNDGTVTTYGKDDGGYKKNKEEQIRLASNEGKVNFMPTQNGVNASYNNGGTIFSSKIGTSNQYGPSIDVGVATKLGDSAAVAIDVEGGANVQRVLGSLGFSFNGGNLIFSGEHLGVKGKYTFSSGEVEEMVRQNKAGVALNVRLTEGFLHALVLDGSITKAESKDLENKEVVIDTATLFSIYNNYRRIAGGELKQASAGFVFKVTDNTRLELKAKYETLTYDTMYSASETKSAVGGDMKLTHNFGNGVTGNVSAGTSIAGNTYGAGVEMPVGKDGKIGFEVRHRDGKDGLKPDTYAGLTYRTTFGGGLNKAPSLFASNNYSNIVADVLARNNSFASHGVLAKVDQKMVRVLEIDKTNLPAGTNIVNNGGDLEVSSLDVLSIAGVTRDAVPFANGGQFTIVGGKLRIITKNIQEPASGTNTYVVTTNNVGGGTAEVTIVVAKGSVIIQSVNIVTLAAQVAPVMGDVPNQTATSGSAFSLNVGPYVTLTNGDAVTSYTLTGTLPTGVTFNSSTGVLSGTPTQTGTFNLSVTATDNDGVSNSDSFTLTVNEAQVAPVLGDVPNQTATSGSAFSLNVGPYVTLTNGDAVTSYTLTGALPTGVTFNSSTGVLSGTPTQTGTFNLSVTATDNDGASNSDSFTLTVNAAPDPVPNAFDIPNLTNQTINTVVTTAGIVVAGTNTSSTASTTVGTIVKNGADTGSASTTVNSGDTVAVRLTTSGSYSTTINGVLNIEGVTDSFSVTTEAAPNVTPTLNLSLGGIFQDNGGDNYNAATDFNVTFDASGSVDDGSVTRLLVRDTTNNVTIYDGASLTHAYMATGKFGQTINYSIQVFDNNSVGSTVRNITINYIN